MQRKLAVYLKQSFFNSESKYENEIYSMSHLTIKIKNDTFPYFLKKRSLKL